MIAQALFIAKLVPSIGVVAGAIIAPMALAFILTAMFGKETRGGDLRHLDEAALPA